MAAGQQFVENMTVAVPVLEWVVVEFVASWVAVLASADLLLVYCAFVVEAYVVVEAFAALAEVAASEPAVVAFAVTLELAAAWVVEAVVVVVVVGAAAAYEVASA